MKSTIFGLLLCCLVVGCSNSDKKNIGIALRLKTEGDVDGALSILDAIPQQSEYRAYANQLSDEYRLDKIEHFLETGKNEQASWLFKYKISNEGKNLPKAQELARKISDIERKKKDAEEMQRIAIQKEQEEKQKAEQEKKRIRLAEEKQRLQEERQREYDYTRLPVYDGFAELGYIRCKRYNDVWKTFTKDTIGFVYGQQAFSLYVEDLSVKHVYKFSISETASLVRMLDHYHTWAAQACQQKVEITKELGTLTSDLSWRSGDDWYIGAYPSSVTILFFSRTETQHEVILRFPKTTSRSNQYIDTKPRDVYIEEDDIISLENLLKVSHVSSCVKKAIDQKKLEDTFK